MRLIDREALCQDLLDRWNVADEKEEEEIQNVMADVVTPIVFLQPTIEMPSWTSCSERLPDDVDVGEEFPIVIFCTSTTTYVGFYEYNRGRWWNSAYEEVVSDVIAWQPLPEPYREDGES